MPRYFLIDNCTGYLFADSAVIDEGGARDETPTDAARRFHGRLAVSGDFETADDLDPGEPGYHVYRAYADLEDDAALPFVRDGRDLTAIESVERESEYVGALRFVRPTP